MMKKLRTVFSSLQRTEHMTPRPGISSSKSRPRSGQGSVPARGGTGRPTFPSLLSLCPGGHPVTQHIHSPGLTHSQAPEALRAQLSERHPRGSWEDQREAVRKAAWGRWRGHIHPPWLWPRTMPRSSLLGEAGPWRPGGLESLRLIAQP